MFCNTVNLCFRSAKGKESVKRKWNPMINFDSFFFCALEEKNCEWLNEALMCWVVCQEDEKAKNGPITPTLALNQTASRMSDVMRGCGKWGWLMLLSTILATSVCLLLHLLFCYQTQTHINTVSLCVCQPVSLCNLEQQHQTFISSLMLLMQSFQTQWGRIG